MKKLNLVFAGICLAFASNAQSWNVTLNTITGNPNFGTASNHPINFFTNNSQKMTLTTTGVLRINSLVGTGNRFIQADANGNLVEWTGSLTSKDYALYGDGSFKLAPVLGDAGIYYTAANSKFGIGVTTPATALDVNGDATISGLVKAPNGFLFNTTNGMNYNSTDNMIFLGKLGAGSPALDPCLVLANASTQGWVNAANAGFVTSQIPGGSSLVNAAMRMFIEPSNGSAYIELSGKDNTNSSNNSLYLNYNCSRNTRINTGTSGGYVYLGSSSATSKVFVGDFINMNKHVEIGDPTTGIINAATNTALDINVNSGNGLRFNTATATTPLLTDMYNSTNVYSIYGDGQTKINTANLDAIVVQDPNLSNQVAFKLHSYGTAEFSSGSDALTVSQTSGGPVNFKLHSNGNAEFSTAATNAITVKNGNAGATAFNVRSNGYSEITTANTKALSVYNANNLNKESFSINNDGYTEIKVYSPAGMPVPSYGTSTWPITHPRVITVRDVTFNSNAGRDLFVVRADGTVFAREIEINNGDNFPDYVFEKDYKLISIADLEGYINLNKHLPGFEKASHYEENGINVNNLLTKQQEKIEELTLYIIQLEKRLRRVESGE